MVTFVVAQFFDTVARAFHRSGAYATGTKILEQKQKQDTCMLFATDPNGTNG